MITLTNLFLLISTITFVVAQDDISILNEAEAREKVVELIDSNFQNYNVDLTQINGKLKFFKLPQINNNLLELVLNTYNSSTKEVAEIVVRSDGDVPKIIEDVNDIFNCELFFIEDGDVKVDLYNFNTVLGKTKTQYINQVSSKHRFVGYVMGNLIDKENKTYYPIMKKEIKAFNVPVEDIETSLQPTFEALNRYKRETRVVAIYEIKRDSNSGETSTMSPENPDDFFGIGTIISSIVSPIHKYINEIINNYLNVIQSYKIIEEPANVIERLYANAVNTGVNFMTNIAKSAQQIINNVLERFIIENEGSKIRSIRAAGDESNLGIFDSLFQSIYNALTNLVNTLTNRLNTITGGLFPVVWETVRAVLNGLIGRIIPHQDENGIDGTFRLN